MFKEQVELTGNLTQGVKADGSNVRDIILGKLAVIAACLSWVQVPIDAASHSFRVGFVTNEGRVV
jgi:hypothetical protein